MKTKTKIAILDGLSMLTFIGTGILFLLDIKSNNEKIKAMKETQEKLDRNMELNESSTKNLQMVSEKLTEMKELVTGSEVKSSTTVAFDPDKRIEKARKMGFIQD